MKLSQAFLVVLLVSLAAITVHADGVPNDARIIVGHDPNNNGCGLTFTITVNVMGGGHKPCRNDSGVEWTGLDFFVNLPTGTDLTQFKSVCSPTTPFSTCSPVPTIVSVSGGTETVEIMFLNGHIGTGPSDSLFFVSLNNDSSDMEGAGGWTKGTIITGKAVVPEPSTFLLLLSGLGAAWLRGMRESTKRHENA